MKRIARRGWLAFACLAASTFASAQITVQPIDGVTVTPMSMAQALATGASGITINNATYTGANGASGMFTGGNGIIGVVSGIVLTSGSVNSVPGPNNSANAGTDNGLPGDPDLTVLAGAGAVTHDASVLTITFTPTGNQITFSYVFGSEEYNEFVNSQYNDVFGFFVNNVNRALIPGTSTPVAINNVNCGFSNPGVAPPGAGPNCNLYVNNDPPTHNTQLDGFTQILTFTANVNPNVQNTLKIAIADTSDGIYDSAVLIAGGSLSICGGPGQPPCGGPGPGPGPGGPPPVIPTMSEWGLLIIALLAGASGMYALRRRRR